MRSYTINLPRGLEVDIFNLPDNFAKKSIVYLENIHRRQQKIIEIATD
jgi:hypothetical protein